MPTPAASQRIPMQGLIERIILWSRYILIVFYVGLGVALAIFAAKFFLNLWNMAQAMPTASDTDMLLWILVLIDKSLVAGLVVMVMLSSYENFVGRFDQQLASDKPTWLGRLDPGSLKIKVAASIVAISSINLLQIFMNMSAYSHQQVVWKTIIHVVFLFSALLLAFLDRLTALWAKQASEATAAR
jgi:uncharacterized protein (TIGR00645 family)